MSANILILLILEGRIFEWGANAEEGADLRNHHGISFHIRQAIWLDSYPSNKITTTILTHRS